MKSHADLCHRRAEVGVVEQNDVQWNDSDLVNTTTLQWRHCSLRPITGMTMNSFCDVSSCFLIGQQVLSFTQNHFNDYRSGVKIFNRQDAQPTWSKHCGSIIHKQTNTFN